MVEIRDSVSQLDWVVIREQMTQRAKPYPLCPQKRLGDQQIRGRTGLPGRCEVLSNPRLLEAERVKQLQII
jgi:hypothetical protein